MLGVTLQQHFLFRLRRHLYDLQKQQATCMAHAQSDPIQTSSMKSAHCWWQARLTDCMLGKDHVWSLQLAMQATSHSNAAAIEAHAWTETAADKIGGGVVLAVVFAVVVLVLVLGE